MPRPAAVAAALLGCLICAIVLHLAQVRADAAWIVAAVVPWGVAVSLGVREDVPLLRVLALAAVARLTLVGTPPLLSDDLYRYLFEGQALLAGHNPFVEPPATLAALDPALAARVNHADIPSIYPPVALLWFQLLALFGSAAWIPQLGAALVDVGNAGLLHRLLDRDGRPTWPAALYALHPLPVLESAQGGHLEPLAVLACLGFLVLLPRRPWLASAAMTAGIGVKLLPVLFVPTLVRRLGPARALAAVTIGGLALVALAAPVLSAGPALFEALGTYSRHWSFNGLVHPLLEPWLEDGTRRVLGALGLLVALVATALPDPRWAWYAVGTGFLVLSPTVHPWYVLWALVPSLALGRRDWALGAVALQASYLVLATLDGAGSWAPQPWLGPLTWGGVAVGFLYARRLDRPTVP